MPRTICPSPTSLNSKLRLFGNTEVQHVTAQVGPEQEYFLIDKSAYERREDLKLWHTVGSALYALQWLCTGLLLWRATRQPQA